VWLRNHERRWGVKSGAKRHRGIKAVGALAAAVVAGAASGQDLGHKAPPQAKPVMIYNATIHPVSGEPIKDGFVMFTAGKINGIGTVGEKIDIEKNKADGWEMIDGRGKHVYPGLIASYSQLGLTEIAAVRATLDYGEVGQATPEVRAAAAVNPDSTLIPVTRSNGVLIAGIFPSTGLSGQTVYFDGPGGLVPGRAGVMTLDGWTWEQMAIDTQAGLVLNWPSMRPVSAWWMNRAREEQERETERTLGAIEKLFDDALAYREQATSKSDMGPRPVDLRFEAMQAVLPPPPDAAKFPGQKPVFVMANDYDQVVAAVEFGARRGLKIVIVGGMDAHLCVNELKRHDVPVIITGLARFPKRADGDYDEPFSLPAKLKAAGVRFCISSGEEAANERNLPYAAGMAAAFGLDQAEALRSITLSAAEILGVNDRFGSLELDKSATLIVTDGDVLEITTNVEHAWIDGRKIDLNNKQVELEKKYREKYRQLKGK
jgi:imidazolonepropionase-like amidohydrolase